MVIAIDGVACSGKGTISKRLGEILNINVFDTGAMYRAIAVEWDRQNMGQVEEGKISLFLKSFDISVKFSDRKQMTLVNGEDYTSQLRTPYISDLSSQLSAYRIVREKVMRLQRDYASKHDCIMEGRDITSEVLPDADFKFFMTADLTVRAKRRVEQLKAKGEIYSYNKIYEELKERDFRDMNREFGRLRVVEDAIVVDTTNNTVEESIKFCLDKIKG